MLIDVLNRVAQDSGLHPVQQRSTLLKHLNSSAKEMHGLLECTAIQREVTLIVNPDSIVSLPYFIGQVLGIRKTTNDEIADLHSIGFPRYVRNTQHYKLNGWRVLGESPIQQFFTQLSSQLVFSTQHVENASITVRGPTSFGQVVEETIVLDEESKVGEKAFLREIESISSSTPNRTANIQIHDATDTIHIATLYNNQVKTHYKLIDVSEVSWSADTVDSQSLIDVWYKLPITELTRDTDSFFAGDAYDNAWYFMAMHYHYIGKDAEAAKNFRAFCINNLRIIKQSQDGKLERRMTFGPNKYIEAQRVYDTKYW